ncbi:hypothetical protein Mucpa_4635 [Mucilaginibacter paludis DSM 18603]|uniref:Uncharacterized protein n=1 Tax=Mucilaginibacter paludis DSM 18603 TaxID=714943 RepID=H1Y8V7_9SPHI|nr:hypothetical protein Mucpa_4635 [Mucilaginibacter paludis DSM 18603]
MNYHTNIVYYCFNKHCKTSIYHRDAVHLNLTFSLDTLITDHFCSSCSSKLVSLIDVEIRQTLAATCCH